MHEGDHSILDDEHDHPQGHTPKRGHPHDHTHPDAAHAHSHDHAHPHAQTPLRRADPARLIAGVIVAAAVVGFLVWRFL